MSRLLPLFFLPGTVISDSSLDLENPPVEAEFASCRAGLLELLWQPISSRLKYSISCMMRDPTVPLVPIATGLDFKAILSENAKPKLWDICTFSFTLGGKVEACGRIAASGLILVGDLLRV
ncbi:UNVERIFIED_CONTAM: hypothetical protein Sindi_2800900 [Sesamum indicum]